MNTRSSSDHRSRVHHLQADPVAQTQPCKASRGSSLTLLQFVSWQAAAITFNFTLPTWNRTVLKCQKYNNASFTLLLSVILVLGVKSRAQNGKSKVKFGIWLICIVHANIAHFEPAVILQQHVGEWCLTTWIHQHVASARHGWLCGINQYFRASFTHLVSFNFAI